LVGDEFAEQKYDRAQYDRKNPIPDSASDIEYVFYNYVYGLVELQFFVRSETQQYPRDYA